MRSFILYIIIISMALGCQAQEPVTKVILIRHAEKANVPADNPVLNKAGEARAQELVKILKDEPVAKILSTTYTRTKMTVTPLAKSRNMAIEEYEPLDIGRINQAIKEGEGKTVVICGHSNTIPTIINALIGQNTYSDIDEDDYDNIFIVKITSHGKDAERLKFSSY